MFVFFDESGQPFVDVGRNPPIDDGVRITLVSNPGWDSGGPVLRYRRYKSDGSLYGAGPDLPVRSATDNAVAVLILETYFERHSGVRASGGILPDGVLTRYAEMFSRGESWRTHSPKGLIAVAGYTYAAFSPTSGTAQFPELSDAKLSHALDAIWPLSDETPRAHVRPIYSGEGVALEYGESFNFCHYRRNGTLELSSPIYERNDKYAKVLPVYSVLGDLRVMIAQAAAFYRDLGISTRLIAHVRLTGVQGWRIPTSAGAFEREWPDAFSRDNVDIGPLAIDESREGRRTAFAKFADRLYNQAGRARCPLLQTDGTILKFDGQPLHVHHLPEGE